MAMRNTVGKGVVWVLAVLAASILGIGVALSRMGGGSSAHAIEIRADRYYAGRGVRQDYSTAAARGDNTAAVKLGLMTADDRDARPDQAAAARWFLTAATRGDGRAVYYIWASSMPTVRASRAMRPPPWRG